MTWRIMDLQMIAVVGRSDSGLCSCESWGNVARSHDIGARSEGFSRIELATWNYFLVSSAEVASRASSSASRLKDV